MFQRICAVAMFVAALFISVIPNADARQDIYAFTYNGNNWYVDRDSIDRSKPDGLLQIEPPFELLSIEMLFAVLPLVLVLV